MAKMCELEARIAEAWGDAPFLIPRVGSGVTSDSEKSFPFQIWSHSTSGSIPREGDGIRLKKDHRRPSAQRLKSILQNSRATLHESAYFSPRPPSSPLCLVPQISLQPPYEDIFTNECLQTNFEEIYEREHYSKTCLVIRNMVENIVDKVVDMARYFKSSDALRKLHVDKSAAAVISVTSVEVGAITRTNSPLRLKSRIINTRNIAVQAKINKLEQDKTVKTEHAQAEWSGSVRALRDSHVRLVLRQLKHIERLNRALDRRQ